MSSPEYKRQRAADAALTRHLLDVVAAQETAAIRAGRLLDHILLPPLDVAWIKAVHGGEWDPMVMTHTLFGLPVWVQGDPLPPPRGRPRALPPPEGY